MWFFIIVLNLILKKLYNPWPGKIYNNYNNRNQVFLET